MEPNRFLSAQQLKSKLRSKKELYRVLAIQSMNNYRP